MPPAPLMAWRGSPIWWLLPALDASGTGRCRRIAPSPRLSAEIDRGEKRVLLLYTPALDGLMHATGPESGAVREALAGYARRIRELWEHAGERYEEVRLFVFGDHGMAPVRGVHDLKGELASAGFGSGGPVLYFLTAPWHGSGSAPRPTAGGLRRFWPDILGGGSWVTRSWRVWARCSRIVVTAS